VGRRGPGLSTNSVLPSYTQCAIKTAISLPDDTFERVERAARKMGVSRSEFFARAAERWLDALDDNGTTDAVNRAIAGLPDESGFTDAAAAALAQSQDHG
jgi:metal-responsive CopG/Arc/MetJ family transcriptional regulator